MATTPTYEIDYNDERFNQVKTDEKNALNEYSETYNGMIAETDKYYDSLIESTEKWKDTQTDIQNQQTDFTIQQIEQQREQAQKDYTKEQAGAYVDWRKQSNQYGSEAEKMASAGLSNTGFSESSQVSMYNTYQNRVATARESLNQAMLNYDNAIKDAQLQNNAALAEIALQTLEKQAEYSLQAFQYKNQLVLDLADKKMEVKQFYADQWQNVLNQMNTENALAEEVRQFNENLDFQSTQAELERQWKTKEAEIDREFQAAQAEIERKYKSAEAELDRKHDKEMLEAETEAKKKLLEKEHQQALEKLKKQQEYEMAQLDKQLANQKALAKYEYDLEQSSKSATLSSGSSGTKVNRYTGSGGNAKIYSTSDKKQTSSFTGSTYKEASAYLKSKGVTNNAMTENEWSRRKNSYAMTGQGAEEVKRFSTYEAYIQSYVKYRTGG